jgi:membrane-bound lytic murein transglycosylase F
MSGDTPDLVQAFAEALGNDVKVKGVSVGWEEQFLNKDGKVVREDSYTPALLKSATCDFYATGLAKNPWRAKKMDFAMINPSRMEVVVAKSKKAAFNTPADLSGKSAAVTKESAYHTWLLEQNQSAYKASPVRIEFVGDENEMLTAVDSAKVDFTLVVAEDAIPMLKRQFQNSAVAFPVGPVLEMSWAFRKDDKDLQAAADKFLKAQRDQKDSLLNQQFKNLYEMSVPEFSAVISQMK